jgi:hypothetical protein
MTRDQVQGILVQLLLDKVRETRYPSPTHLDLIEASIPPAMIPDYVEVLVEKVTQDTHPSLSHLRRLQRVAQRLPLDQQEDD